MGMMNRREGCKRRRNVLNSNADQLITTIMSSRVNWKYLDFKYRKLSIYMKNRENCKTAVENLVCVHSKWSLEQVLEPMFTPSMVLLFCIASKQRPQSGNTQDLVRVWLSGYIQYCYTGNDRSHHMEDLIISCITHSIVT